MRPKNRANLRYTGSSKPNRYVRQPLIEAPRFAKSAPDDATCCDCGWPLSAVSGSPLFAGAKDGEVRFKHYLCPTLSRRAELRRAALVSA